MNFLVGRIELRLELFQLEPLLLELLEIGLVHQHVELMHSLGFLGRVVWFRVQVGSSERILERGICGTQFGFMPGELLRFGRGEVVVSFQCQIRWVYVLSLIHI